MNDKEKISAFFRAAIWEPVYRRFVDEMAKADSDIKHFILSDDGKITSDVMVFTHAGMLPELFRITYWSGRESEALAFYDLLYASIPENLRDVVLPMIDLAELRRAAIKADPGSPGFRRYVRPKGLQDET